MTADAVTGVKENVLKVGMNDYVTKPIQLDILGKAMLKWVKSTSISGVVSEPVPIKETLKCSLQDLLRQKLSKLSCLNYEDALTRLAGKENLLIRLLLQFCKENKAIELDITKA